MVHPYRRAPTRGSGPRGIGPRCGGVNILTTVGQTPFIPFRVPADGIPRPP